MLYLAYMGNEKKTNWQKMERRSKTLRPLGKSLPKVLKSSAAKNGFFESDMLMNWRKICPEYFDCTRPIKLFKGLLTVAVSSDSAKLQLQYWLPTLIQRLNGYYGAETVHSVRLVTRHFPPKTPEVSVPKAPAVTPDARTDIVKDEKLKTALLKLGRWLKTDTK